MSVAVIYLARGAGAGLLAVEAFLDSYNKWPAGLEHDLIVLRKGWKGVPGAEDLGPLVARHGGTLIDLPDDGFDWGAYMRVGRLIDHEWILFLNSHSRVLCENWLKYLHEAAAGTGVGVAGATGSWGTIRPVLRFIIPTVKKITFSRGLLRGAYSAVFWIPKALCLWLVRFHRFPTFPNPHLRSNAFLMQRQLFNDFFQQRNIPKRKRDAWDLESGFNGLTHWVESKNLKAVVVDSGGNQFHSTEWMRARTFRHPQQGGLLIEDNQTRAYDRCSEDERWHMELSAWGCAADQVDAEPPLVSRPLK